MKIVALVLLGLILLAVAAGVIWLIIRSIKRAEDPARIAFKWTLTLVIGALFWFGIVLGVEPSVGAAFIVPIVCVALGVVMSILWAPHLGALFAKPLTSLFDGGTQDWKPEAMYSIAIARRKRGQFNEAIEEIEKQLARWPTDLSGQLLLAEIQADDLHDLEAARQTVERILAQPNHAPKNISYALNLIADWELKYYQDYVAARRSLERIAELLPDTPEAQNAAQRLAHLDQGSMEAAQNRTAIPLPAGVNNVGLRVSSAELKPLEKDPDVLVGEYVLHLDQHPLDAEVREKLALLYAEHYHEREMAVEQLRMLVDYPNQPQRQVARWLNLIADVHVKLGQDYEAAQAALTEIVDKYPTLACAHTAQQRLAHLKLEIKGVEKISDVKMGIYEQNIGLKGPDRPPLKRRPS